MRHVAIIHHADSRHNVHNVSIFVVFQRLPAVADAQAVREVEGYLCVMKCYVEFIDTKAFTVNVVCNCSDICALWCCGCV
jgi:hypothetical protein